MSKLPRVKVVNPVGNGPLGTEYYIDGQRISRVLSVNFQVAVDEIPTFTFETLGAPEIDMQGDVQFSFTPQTVTEAVKVLRNELLKHGELYNGFLASVRSTIKEFPNNKIIWTDELTETILRRIIGED